MQWQFKYEIDVEYFVYNNKEFLKREIKLN